MKQTQGTAIGEENTTIQVMPCIPYRNSSSPYPFNTVPDNILDDYTQSPNPYFSNHTCCIGDMANPSGWRLATRGENKLCYHLVETGGLTDFDGTKPEISKLSTRPIPNLRKPTRSDVGAGGRTPNNDGFRRELKVYCDGKRGNTCQISATNYDHTYWRIEHCPVESIADDKFLQDPHPICYGVDYGDTECHPITTDHLGNKIICPKDTSTGTCRCYSCITDTDPIDSVVKGYCKNPEPASACGCA